MGMAACCCCAWFQMVEPAWVRVCPESRHAAHQPGNTLILLAAFPAAAAVVATAKVASTPVRQWLERRTVSAAAAAVAAAEAVTQETLREH